jgi:hypothetical protein
MNRAQPIPGGGCIASPFWQANDGWLRDLAFWGLTTREAGQALGVTKNAVIGRGRRIGLTWARTPEMAPKPQKPTIEFPPPNGCRFPHGHPGASDFHFCGERVIEIGEPYCEAHTKLTHVKSQPQQEAA